MLVWPALRLLKKQYPDIKITVLIPAYTQPIAELCSWIDNILIDTNRVNSYSGGRVLSKIIKTGNFDAVITLFSEFRTGLAVWLCRIPLRVAPASKIAQIFYNHRLLQKRSRSEKPEFEYNTDLIRYFIELQGDRYSFTPEPPYLVFDNAEIVQKKNEFLSNNHIDATSKIIIVHAGSGGSANNLTIKQYAMLINALAHDSSRHFIITAGPDERDNAQQLANNIRQVNHTVYHSTQGMVSFAKLIAACDLFISGSTGPLHIAGALNKATAAFYPARRSATALRWKTLNKNENQLAFMPENNIDKTDLSAIDVTECANLIDKKLLK